MLGKLYGSILPKKSQILAIASLNKPTSPYPSLLQQVGYHDDDANVLLPHHPPEVFQACLQWTLGCYVCFWVFVPLEQLIIKIIYIHTVLCKSLRHLHRHDVK